MPAEAIQQPGPYACHICYPNSRYLDIRCTPFHASLKKSGPIDRFLSRLFGPSWER